jgi:anti-sigma factor RsiW
MQHDQAARTHAAERYLLGEMPDDERELYEEHFFSCTECEAELAAAAAFVDNARAVLRTPQARILPAVAAEQAIPWWRRLFVAPSTALVPALSAAVLLLGTLVVYQQFSLIPGLREQVVRDQRPQGVPTLALRSAARGTGPRLVVGAEDQFAVLQADVIADAPVDEYRVMLLNAGLVEQWSTAITAPEPGIPATILVPVRDLAAGDYTLIFRDGERDGRELVRFQFTLDKQ